MRHNEDKKYTVNDLINGALYSGKNNICVENMWFTNIRSTKEQISVLSSDRKINTFDAHKIAITPLASAHSCLGFFKPQRQGFVTGSFFSNQIISFYFSQKCRFQSHFIFISFQPRCKKI